MCIRDRLTAVDGDVGLVDIQGCAGTVAGKGTAVQGQLVTVSGTEDGSTVGRDKVKALQSDICLLYTSAILFGKLDLVVVCFHRVAPVSYTHLDVYKRQEVPL